VGQIGNARTYIQADGFEYWLLPINVVVVL